MTTCNDSKTKSPAESASAADTKATSVIIETPQLEAPKSDAIETAGVLLVKYNAVPARDAPQRLDASSLKALSAVAAIAEAPALEPAPAPAEPLTADDPPLSARSAGAAAAAPIATAQKQPGRLLAASLVFAAGIGATVGAFAMSGFARPVPEQIPEQTAAAPAPVLDTEEIRALKSTIAQLRSELAALKTGVETGARSTNGQFANISEGIDRAPSAQTAKTNKALDGVERLEKRADLVPARDVTGSVPQPNVPTTGTFPRPAIAPPLSFPPGTRPIVNGWIVLEAQNGVAVIQGPRGAIAVERGDLVSGLGRISEIRKQGNRWVVMTARGPIISMW